MTKDSKPTGVRLKASTIRCYIRLLEADGHLAALKARVPAETAALIANPPLASTWTEWKHMLAINNAIEALWGMNGVRDYGRRAIVEMKGFHIRLIEGLLRLWGTSPATIYKRLTESIRSTCEGIDYRYEALTDHSGNIEVHYAVADEIPLSVFVGAIPTLLEILRLCGTTGVVGNPERLSPNSARYAIRW